MAIEDQKDILVDASPEAVFDVIETMPNKFPVYKVLEKTPFIFFRMFLVDGLHAAIQAVRVEKPIDQLVLHPGASIGPFILSKVERPYHYVFELNSFFFHCRTGYMLSADGDATRIHFILNADHPGVLEKVYWALIKPIHRILAGKVLKVIKQRVEWGLCPPYGSPRGHRVQVSAANR